MLISGTHYRNVELRYKQLSTQADRNALFATVTDAGVLRQLQNNPIGTITFRLGGDPGEYDRGDIFLDSTSRVRTDERTVTHHFAPTTAEYRSWVLLHEIGHHLTTAILSDTAAKETFLTQHNKKVCVTEYSLKSFREYVAETFTSTLVVPELHAEDRCGVAEMQRVLSTW